MGKRFGKCDFKILFLNFIKLMNYEIFIGPELVEIPVQFYDNFREFFF